jgi:hypothetical protein
MLFCQPFVSLSRALSVFFRNQSYMSRKIMVWLGACLSASKMSCAYGRSLSKKPSSRGGRGDPSLGVQDRDEPYGVLYAAKSSEILRG